MSVAQLARRGLVLHCAFHGGNRGHPKVRTRRRLRAGGSIKIDTSCLFNAASRTGPAQTARCRHPTQLQKAMQALSVRRYDTLTKLKPSRPFYFVRPQVASLPPCTATLAHVSRPNGRGLLIPQTGA